MIRIKSNRDKISGEGLLSILILFLILFGSGGVFVINFYLVTVFAIMMIVAKIFIFKRFSLVVFFKCFGTISAVLLLNIIATDSFGSLREYIVYLSYGFLSSLFLATFQRLRVEFIYNLYIALIIILIHSLVSFVCQFIVFDELIALDHRNFTYLFLFYYIPSNQVFGLIRSQGVFWEPGVLQVYLNILIYISLFIKKNQYVTVFSAIGILLTFSTTGYVVVFIIIGVFISLNYTASIKLFARLCIYLAVFLPLLYLNVNNKIFGSDMNSARVRNLDFLVGYQMMMDKPTFGFGLGSERHQNSFASFGSDDAESYGVDSLTLIDKGTSNSIMFIITAFGIPFGVLFIYRLYNQNLIGGPKALLFSILMISGFSVPIFNTPFFTILVLSSIFLNTD